MASESSELPGIASLRSIAVLISSTVEELAAEYIKNGQDLPSLEGAEQTRHPLLDDLPNFKLLKSVKVLEAACGQLTALVADPGQALMTMALQHTFSASLRVVCEYKIADHLRAKPDGVSIEELASLCGVDKASLGTIMKTLASAHVFQEVRPNVFANNRRSVLLTSDSLTTSIISLMAGEGLLASPYLHEAIQLPSQGAPVVSAFQKATGKTFFDWFATDPVGMIRDDNFNRAMVALDANSTPGSNLVTAFPWAKILADKPDIVICDVGGGAGSACLPVLRKYSTVKLFVQDLPTTVQSGQDLWRSELPDALAGSSPRVQFTPLNFFEATPVKDCDYYYIRHVLHNWSDEQVLLILKSITSSMKQSSRLLIHEFLSQHVSEGFSLPNVIGAPELQDLELVKTPSPLLPNFGMGSILRYEMDMCMNSVMSSRVRTFDEFCGLAETINLEFIACWPQGEKTILEFKLTLARS